MLSIIGAGLPGSIIALIVIGILLIAGDIAFGVYVQKQKKKNKEEVIVAQEQQESIDDNVAPMGETQEETEKDTEEEVSTPENDDSVVEVDASNIEETEDSKEQE